MNKAAAGLLVEQIEMLSYMVAHLNSCTKAAENVQKARDPEGYLLYQAEVKEFNATHPNRVFINRMEEILEMMVADELRVGQTAARR
jgi:hypothetical protein